VICTTKGFFPLNWEGTDWETRPVSGLGGCNTELLLLHEKFPVAVSSFRPMSITAEQACWNDSENVTSHVGLHLQNHWLCTDDLFLVETEDCLYIFVSCVEVVKREPNSVILL